MGTRLTPMNILRDNIKLKIDQAQGFHHVHWLAKIEAYNSILKMIEGDSLGKPLIDQEEELFIDAFMDGVFKQEELKDLTDIDNCKAAAKEILKKRYTKDIYES